MSKFRISVVNWKSKSNYCLNTILLPWYIIPAENLLGRKFNFLPFKFSPTDVARRHTALHKDVKKKSWVRTFKFSEN